MFRLAEGEGFRVAGSPETFFNDAVQCNSVRGVFLRFAGQLVATGVLRPVNHHGYNYQRDCLGKTELKSASSETAFQVENLHGDTVSNTVKINKHVTKTSARATPARSCPVQ